MNRSPRRPRASRKPAGATSQGPRPRRPAPRRRRANTRRSVVALVAVTASALLCTIGLWLWGRSASPASKTAPFIAVELPATLGPGEVLTRLQAAGVLEQADLTRAYQLVLHPWFDYAPGVHWLRPGHSAAEVLALVGRTRARPVVRVVLPEGWDAFQMAERLASVGVCAPETFVSRVLGRSEPNSTSNYSLEGHLYPASYDFRLNSSADEVVERLNKEANSRYQQVFSSLPTALSQLEHELGLSADDVVTLASVVEKEAANAAELRLVASVFLNRLRDPNFRPARMLQSDPTAGYGCKVYTQLASCAGYTGRVTPTMLRDPANPFNTYKRPGLPPSPIGNPSTTAVEAVLSAPSTNYYFFVSHNGGPHQFSQTLDAHEAATRSP